jgi:GxxExxY protein
MKDLLGAWVSSNMDSGERGDGDPLTYAIIGAAMDVRKALGCGLLESAYHAFLCVGLTKAGLAYVSQPTLAVQYQGIKVNAGFRPDMIVSDRVIVEIKSVSELLPVHKAQLLTYMRLSRIETGLLLNFNAIPFTKGIVRMVLTPIAA